MGRAAFFAMGMSAVALVASVTMQPVAAGVATLEGPAAAVRGDAVQTQPMPDPPVVYPVGRCDTLVPGLPGLAPHTWPDRMVDLGRSVEARPIWAEYWGPTDPHRVVVLVAQTHGDECSPTLVPAQVRSDPPARTGVWLIPTINPDGYARYSRRNVNGIDLNRDGGNSNQQVETVALMEFLRSVRPDLTVYVHSPNGFMGAFPHAAAPIAGPACVAIAHVTSMRCSGNGAGARPSRAGWFLWQGQQDVLPGSDALLIELPAVAHAEVPHAQPRPPTQSVADVERQVAAIMEVLDALP